MQMNGFKQFFHSHFLLLSETIVHVAQWVKHWPAELEAHIQFLLEKSF